MRRLCVLVSVVLVAVLSPAVSARAGGGLADLPALLPVMDCAEVTGLAAMDPDLGRFQRGGGKLLLWHGWNDQHIAPRGTLAYYDAMRETMGQRGVDRFARLYLFPGVAHCGGGEGPNTFDVLTPVMAWVEGGKEPGKIVASNAARTRPVFPYPAVARYDGSGSVDDAANFVASTPRQEPRTDYRWLGERLYSSDYQTWCTAVGTKLVCRPSETWLTRRVR